MVTTEQPARELNTRATTPTGNAPTYDLICIGFGPAQIATAIANHESPNPSNILFLERKPVFSWHPSAQLPRTRMENSFIYDLATTRNPRSAFSYVNYLLAQNRLVEFANSDRLNPLREEFEDYLRWCAQKFKDQVRYQSEVVGVIPDQDADSVRSWKVTVKGSNGSTYMVRTKNLAAPSPPTRNRSKALPLTGVNFEAGQRIILMEDYLSRRNELRGVREPRLDIAVVGSGKQTMEILDDLLSCPHLGNITVVTENETLAPLRILAEEPSPPQPRLCSIWAKPSCETKSTVLESSELIQKIYARAYEKQVKGECSLRVVIGSDATTAAAQASFIIAENLSAQLPSSGVFHGLDALVLGCRQKGDSLEEVQFKRGTVADGCHIWLLSANSDGGRSLARDIAVRAGEVVKAVAGGTCTAPERDGTMLINARM
jgi:L-ornithine N5-oxygenase